MTDQLTLEQSLQDIFPTLPAPIQRFIKEGKSGEVAQAIMDHYVLHIDQGAIIEHQILLALFGVIGPEEFMETFSNKLSVSDEVVGDIIEDVNKEVFIPLREQMRKGQPAEVKPPQSQPVAPQAPREDVLQPRTTIIPANPNLPQRLVQTLASVPRYVPPKKYFNLQNKIPPPVPTPPIQPVQPQRRDVIPAPAETKPLEDHEEPHIEFSKTPMPAKTAPPPPNLPGVIQPAPIPEPPPTPTPPLPPKPKPVVPVTPYSADPYREPIE